MDAVQETPGAVPWTEEAGRAVRSIMMDWICDPRTQAEVPGYGIVEM